MRPSVPGQSPRREPTPDASPHGGLGRDAGGRRAGPARRANRPEGSEVPGTRPVRWRVSPIRRTLGEAGIRNTQEVGVAAVAVLPLLVPPSAVAWELLPLEDRLALEATEISSAKVCGASECREVSDPEAATALAVGPTPRGTDAPVRGLPWYKSTLTIPAEDGGEVDRVSVSVTVVPSAGLMRVNDGVWVTLPSESKEAYAKLTAGLTPRPARTLPSVGEDALPVARVDEVVEAPSAATPAPRATARTFGSSRWAAAC